VLSVQTIHLIIDQLSFLYYLSTSFGF